MLHSSHQCQQYGVVEWVLQADQQILPSFLATELISKCLFYLFGENKSKKAEISENKWDKHEMSDKE